MSKTIEKLRDDEHYYGEYGRQFVSNSDIKILLDNPFMYGKPVKKTGAMLMGTYIHDVLQGRPRQTEFISEANSRNSKVYKEQCRLMLLQREIYAIQPVLDRVLANKEFMGYILGGDLKPGQIEQPAIGKIFGVNFKAKADRINLEAGYVVDIKTTSDISKFKSSFFKYGYDTQAYIYEVLFHLPMLFAVLDKFTAQLGFYTVSRDTLINAENKVERALKIKDMFFGDDPRYDINEYIHRDEL